MTASASGTAADAWVGVSAGCAVTVDTVEIWSCRAGDGSGAGTSVRAGAAADDEVTVDVELKVGGGAVFVIVGPAASPLWEVRRVPSASVELPAVEVGVFGLVTTVGGAALVDGGVAVAVVEPDPAVPVSPTPVVVVPDGSDAVGEPPGASAPPDGEVPVDDPVLGDSSCDDVLDGESAEPVVSAEATIGV